MPNINEMKISKYLKKEDVGQGALVTISRLDQQNVAIETRPDEMKWTLHFKEAINGDHKPLVLNWTNIQLCAMVCGSDNSDEWTGKQIVLYNDPSVSYGGNITGGIRIRAPQGQATQQSENPAAGVDFNDDIDF